MNKPFILKRRSPESGKEGTIIFCSAEKESEGEAILKTTQVEREVVS